MNLLSIINKVKNAYLYIFDDCRFGYLGNKSRIIKPMRILGKRRIFIDSNVLILNQARLETIREWNNEKLNGKINIGKGTSIEQCCHIVAAKEVSIGNDCVFSAFVYISDCSHKFVSSEKIMDTSLDVNPVCIGNHVFIGIGSCILPGVHIGNNVVIGANSVVTSDVPDDSMAVGSPARVIKIYNYEKDNWVDV